MHFIHFAFFFFFFFQLSSTQTTEAQTVQTEPLDLSMTKKSDEQQQHILIDDEIEKSPESLDLSASEIQLKKIYHYFVIEALKKRIELSKLLSQEKKAKEYELTMTRYGKNFKCNICQKVTKSFSEHMMHHAGVKKYICPLCNKSFSHLWTIKRHLEKFHTV